MTQAWLRPDSPRCRPGCAIRERCGRFLAAMPPQMGSMCDYAALHAALIATGQRCPGYVSPQDCVLPAGAGARVHPADGGLMR